MLDKPTVAVRNLSKTYYLTDSGSEFGLTPRRKRQKVRALLPTNFVAYSGESIGILGQNGSGKSTLLNLVAGNERPTTGVVKVSSRPTLLSVGAALQEHLTGASNVRLGLLAQGLKLERVKEIESGVAAWAGIGDAIGRPMQTYSSGMKARLKFAIATAVPSEILLVDEALSTGDSAFSAKAQKRMDGFLSASGTVFIVAHTTKTISAHCSRALWIHNGELLADGPTKDVTRLYERWSRLTARQQTDKAEKTIRHARRNYTRINMAFDSELIEQLDLS